MTQPPNPPPMPFDVAPPPLAAAAGHGVLPYAIPAGPAPMVAQAWREGALLVVPARATLPARCVKCNADVSADPGSRRLTQTLAWHHPGLYFLILAGILVYAIVALVVQQKATVELSVCNAHRAQRLRWLLFGWGSVALGVAMLIGGCAGGANYARQNDMWPAWLMLGGTVVVVVGGILGMVLARVLTPKRIERGYAWLKGADPGFLQMFPDARQF